MMNLVRDCSAVKEENDVKRRITEIEKNNTRTRFDDDDHVQEGFKF